MLNKNITRVHCYIVCVVATVVYQYSYVNNFFPINEGWFTAYSRLMRLGFKPYIDFDLIVPPLYPLALAVFQAVFGETFYALHVLGLVVTIITCIALFEIYTSFFNFSAAAISAVVSTVYYQNFEVFINYDFPMVMMCLSFVSLLLVLKCVDRVQFCSDRCWNKTLGLLMFLGGVAIGCGIMVKHSIALFTPAATLVSIFVISLSIASLRVAIRHCLFFCVGVSLPIIAILLYVAVSLGGKFDVFFNSIIINALKAKGGSHGIVTSFVQNFFFSGDYLRSTLKSSLTIIFALVLLNIRPIIAFIDDTFKTISGFEYIKLYIARRGVQNIKRNSSTQKNGTILFFILFIVVIYSNSHSLNLFNGFGTFVGKLLAEVSYFSVNMCFYGVPVVMCLALIYKKSIWCKLLLVFAVGASYILCFAASMHAQHVVSTTLGVGLILGLIISFSQTKPLEHLLVLLILILSINYMVEFKMSHPYKWWSIECKDVRTPCESGVGIFSGICTPGLESDKISRIANNIERFSLPSEPVYVYPNMPIFNLVANRLPYDGAVQSWFDFSGNSFIKTLAQKLIYDTPAVIVVAEVPWSDLLQHEKAFGGSAQLPQRLILQSIDRLISKEKIVLVDKVEDISGYTVDVYVKSDRYKIFDQTEITPRR